MVLCGAQEDESEDEMNKVWLETSAVRKRIKADVRHTAHPDQTQLIIALQHSLKTVPPAQSPTPLASGSSLLQTSPLVFPGQTKLLSVSLKG